MLARPGEVSRAFAVVADDMKTEGVYGCLFFVVSWVGVLPEYDCCPTADPAWTYDKVITTETLFSYCCRCRSLRMLCSNGMELFNSRICEQSVMIPAKVPGCLAYVLR